eukprot:gene6907-8242_t
MDISGYLRGRTGNIGELTSALRRTNGLGIDHLRGANIGCFRLSTCSVYYSATKSSRDEHHMIGVKM